MVQYAQCQTSVSIFYLVFCNKLSCYFSALPAQNSSLYTLTPNQLQQTIEQLIAAKIWMGISQHQLSILA